MKVEIQIEHQISFDLLKDRFSHGVEKGIKKSTDKVGHDAKENAPRYLGNLKRSIVPRVPPENSGVKMIGEVFQDPKIASYGKVVEFGSRPHTPPLKPIKMWAKKKGLEGKGGAIWTSIRKHGTKPHPYMRPALKENVENVKAIMTEEINKAINGG